MLTQTTKSLYYGKWPFKIECKIKGAGHMSKVGVDRILRWTDGHDTLPRWHSLSHTRKAEVKEFISIIKKYQDQDIKTRAENNTYSIFCKDKGLLDELLCTLNPWVKSVTKPDTEDQYNFLITEDKKKILCDAYPRTDYHYKLLFKTSIPLETRISFLNWISKSQGNVYIGESTKKWFKGETRYCSQPFCYVKDAQTLTMVMLFIGTYHRKIHEYILKSNINS